MRTQTPLVKIGAAYTVPDEAVADAKFDIVSYVTNLLFRQMYRAGAVYIDDVKMERTTMSHDRPRGFWRRLFRLPPKTWEAKLVRFTAYGRGLDYASPLHCGVCRDPYSTADEIERG